MRALAVATTLASALAYSSPTAADEAQTRFEVAYVVDLLSNTDGGLRRGQRALENLDVVAAHGGENGFSAQVHVLYNNAAVFSEHLIGDLQTVSNIDTPGALRLYELWAAKMFTPYSAELKVGLIDLNSEFDVQEVGGLFLNSSHGIGPDFSQSGLNGPSIFPSTSLAVTGGFSPAPGWRLRAGVFDGAPGDPERPTRTLIRLSSEEGALLVGEAERTLGRVRVAAGAWSYTAGFDAIEPPEGGPRRLRQGRGAYGTVEARLAPEAGSADEGLSGWVRVGAADPNVHTVSFYVGGGLVYTGLLPERPRDQAGFSIAHAKLGGPARRTSAAAGAPLEASETALELTYRLQLADSIALQPDVQYVINPGADPKLDNALVAGIRLELRLTR